jgi:hypothetical protein
MVSDGSPNAKFAEDRNGKSGILFEKEKIDFSENENSRNFGIFRLSFLYNY